MSTVETFVEAVREYFLQRPSQWVSAIDLERVGGRQAWRTRVSDVRRAYRMTIENRVRTLVEPNGQTWRLSEYRYVPSRQTASAAWDANVTQEGRLF